MRYRGSFLPVLAVALMSTGGNAIAADPDVAASGAIADFNRRCAQVGVIRCVGFDDASVLRGKSGGHAGIMAGAAEPALDTSVRASGAGSLKFTIPSKSGANTSGSYFTNFSDDLSVQFGENQEFFVQWRQRFSPEFLSTQYLDGAGWKLIIVGTGDRAGKPYSSCTALEVVAQSYYQNAFPVLYNSCTGSSSHKPYDGFYEPVPGTSGADFKLQNARPSPYCLYSQKRSSYFASGGNCFGYVANEWMTFQLGIRTGRRVNDEFVDSRVRLWMARENAPSELVIDWGPYNLSAGTPADNERFGKVWLLPYNTGKDPTQNHPVGYTWYDELVISRSRIADPGPVQGIPR